MYADICFQILTIYSDPTLSRRTGLDELNRKLVQFGTVSVAARVDVNPKEFLPDLDDRGSEAENKDSEPAPSLTKTSIESSVEIQMAAPSMSPPLPPPCDSPFIVHQASSIRETVDQPPPPPSESLHPFHSSSVNSRDLNEPPPPPPDDDSMLR